MTEEDAFLATLRADPGDDATRLVYADWLDERGRPGGAFLRAECEFAALAPDDPARGDWPERLRGAAGGAAPEWVAWVSRVPVENCSASLEFKFRCPKQWDQLSPTGEATTRFCGECHRQVYFCDSIGLARIHAREGDCVAVDAQLQRWPGDLDPIDQMAIRGAFMGVMALPEEVLEPPRGERPPWWRRWWKRAT